MSAWQTSNNVIKLREQLRKLTVHLRSRFHIKINSKCPAHSCAPSRLNSTSCSNICLCFYHIHLQAGSKQSCVLVTHFWVERWRNKLSFLPFRTQLIPGNAPVTLSHTRLQSCQAPTLLQQPQEQPRYLASAATSLCPFVLLPLPLVSG